MIVDLSTFLFYIFYAAAFIGAIGGVLVARQNVKGFYFLIFSNIIFAFLPNPPRDALTVFMLVYALLGLYSIYSWKGLSWREWFNGPSN